MAGFGKKKKLTEYLYSKPSIFVLGVIAVFMAFAVFTRFSVEREMAARKLETEAQRQELMERKALLEERVEYLSGDRGIEEEIRKHFDVAKEGEQVVIIVDKEEEEQTVPELLEEVKPWYQFW
jgi:flagellar biosynthesis/type III secretory pathway M-ring protein FliF/YscJ